MVAHGVGVGVAVVGEVVHMRITRKLLSRSGGCSCSGARSRAWAWSVSQSWSRSYTQSWSCSGLHSLSWSVLALDSLSGLWSFAESRSGSRI